MYVRIAKMMNDDRLKSIALELTEMNILALYEFMCPMGSDTTYGAFTSRKDAAVKRYQHDPVFYARVNQMVSNTMDIINRYTGNKDG